MQVDDIKVLEGLINPPDTLYIYSAWMVPPPLINKVRDIVGAAENCLGNVVLEQPTLPREHASN